MLRSVQMVGHSENPPTARVQYPWPAAFATCRITPFFRRRSRWAGVIPARSKLSNHARQRGTIREHRSGENTSSGPDQS